MAAPVHPALLATHARAQVIDPHTHEYMTRLKDEPVLLALAQKVSDYLERNGDMRNLAKVGILWLHLCSARAVCSRCHRVPQGLLHLITIRGGFWYTGTQSRTGAKTTPGARHVCEQQYPMHCAWARVSRASAIGGAHLHAPTHCVPAVPPSRVCTSRCAWSRYV